MRKNTAGKNNSMYKHGLRSHSLYSTWVEMNRRCYNSSRHDYEDYGGRKVKVCKRWRHNFELFLEDMGEKPSKEHSIERRNNNKSYSPSNCYWATRKEQQRNKRNTKMLTYAGKTLCMAEWSEITGVSIQKIYQRIKYGWTMGQTLTLPSHGMRGKDVLFNGKIVKTKLLAKLVGLPTYIINRRLNAGMTIEDAMKTPLGTKTGVYSKTNN